MDALASGELIASTETVRIIARLDVKGPNVVRGIHLEGLRIVGQPGAMARRYADAGADELIFIDTVASLYGRNHMRDIIEKTAEDLFIPLTVGGGIRTLQDVDAALHAGADKVTVNSAAVRRPEFLGEMARVFGSQCVVLAIEAKRQANGSFAAYIENGREPTDKEAVSWARQGCDLGCGEILVTSIDQDGMKSGFDVELVRQIAAVVPVPVIASGGAGSSGHVVEVFAHGASAVALGTVLHFGILDISTLKRDLLGAEIRVRPS